MSQKIKYVVDDKNTPIGVVSLTDVFKVIRDHDDGSAEDAAAAQFKHKKFASTVRAAHDHAALSVNGAGDALEMLATPDDAKSNWAVEHVDATHIKLKSGDGKYLAVDAKHSLSLTDDASNGDTTLAVVPSDTGFVALQSAHGGYLEPHNKQVQCKLGKGKNSRPNKRALWKISGAFAKK